MQHKLVKRIALFLIVPLLALNGCTSFQQYVYNCSTSPGSFDGMDIGAKSYFGHRSGKPPHTEREIFRSIYGWALHPIRVNQKQVQSIASDDHDAWDVSKVCPQFDGKIVIVDLQ